jgi:hypothetical protein
MNCPSCGREAGSAAECPGCGIIFAKWKSRPSAAPPAAAKGGVSAGTTAVVLLMTLATVWIYARKTIVFPTPEPVSSDPAPVKLYLGFRAKAPGEIPIPLHPLAKFDGFTKKQIFDMRRSAIAEHPELAGAGYEPSGYVFGGIQDYKPWWGLEGIYFYGDGHNGIAGLSEESRFIPNPFLLVGIREGEARVGQTPDGSVNYYPYPTSLSWNSAASSARVSYNVSEHFDFTANHGYPADIRRRLEFVLYNARDLGFAYWALDGGASKGVDLQVQTGKPFTANQFVHCGPSCGYPGGCNNMSPYESKFLFQAPALPARAVLKLWRSKPDDVAVPADMTFTIDMN